jgi:hypothetical protein
MPNGSDRVTVAPEQPAETDKKVEDAELLKLLNTGEGRGGGAGGGARKLSRRARGEEDVQLLKLLNTGAWAGAVGVGQPARQGLEARQGLRERTGPLWQWGAACPIPWLMLKPPLHPPPQTPRAQGQQEEEEGSGSGGGRQLSARARRALG